MKRSVLAAVSAIAWMAIGGGTAYAWHVEGQVKCPNGVTFSGVEIAVSGTSADGPFSDSTQTDSDGLYHIELPGVAGSYVVSLNTATLPPDATVVGSNPVAFNVTETVFEITVNWEINGDACERAGCWFTGGGTRIDNILGIPVAEKGIKNSFGGNVNPGCSPTAGDGGNWNHIARDLKLHFQGRSIQVTDCGNVTPPPPPGSTSPKTPFNYLECVGTGTLKGVMGNKADYGTVTFFARFEDRNEPGSKDGNAGSGIDRYFLKVVDSGGTTRLLIDEDGIDDGTVDPTEITTGNFQIHVSSCDNPPTP